MHVAVALAYQGAKVAAIDLDPRQRTMDRYLENRAETEQRRGIDAARRARSRCSTATSVEALEALVADAGARAPISSSSTRPAATIRSPATSPPSADTLVTPMNDSFVDFDLIGQVDAETFKVRRLSFYAELIWEARKKRALRQIATAARDGLGRGAQPLQHIEARNMRRIDKALTELSQARRLPRRHGPVASA